MKKFLLFGLLVLLGTPVFAQVTSYGNPVDNGPSLPTTCHYPQIFKKTSAADGNGAVGLYSCDAPLGVYPNNWVGPMATSSAGGPPSGAAGGDLGANYPNPTVTATHLSAALPILQGGTGQSGKQAAFDALAPAPTNPGDVTYYNGTHYVNLAGNAAGT